MPKRTRPHSETAFLYRSKRTDGTNREFIVGSIVIWALAIIALALLAPSVVLKLIPKLFH